MNRVTLAVMAVVLATPLELLGQLAITEMMSAAWGSAQVTNIIKNSDFWELTNFGSNTISLAGYRFSDAKESQKYSLIQNGTGPLLIAPNESIIFVRQTVTTNEFQFREWWGDCLRSNVQIRFYSNPGFSASGDGLNLFDPGQRIVDSVVFGPARPGVSFTYNTQTGDFGVLSVLGENGACQAATTSDIASPGMTAGIVPLRILEHPTDLVACEGLDATLTVRASGLPRPRYQWFHNGSIIFGATRSTLTITNVDLDKIGNYGVTVANGITTLTSTTVRVTIRTNFAAPVILAGPADTTVTTNRTARFSVAVCAVPLAGYQWFTNGHPVPDATNRTWFLPNCTLEMSGTEVCVRVVNSLGTNTACARLFVTTAVDLRITEVQTYPFTDCDTHHDWFEITNFGKTAVDLAGYRFSDEFTLSGAVSVDRSLVVQPNESVVFQKNPSPGIFVDWWGAELLPPGIQIYSYSGFSLGRKGDTLYIWNATAERPEEFIDSVAFAAYLPGVSKRFDYELARYGVDTVPGELGAFRAVECEDIGSPGYVTNAPPRLLTFARTAGTVQLRWRVTEGFTYRCEYSRFVPAKAWLPLAEVRATNAWLTVADPGAEGAGQRFYRLQQVLP